jgi:mono/diheme cytochrome c family protein
MRLTILLLLAVAIAGCAKGSNSSAAASASAAAIKNPASASDGAAVYLANCASCHQANGEGVPGAFPPLAGNPLVTGDPTAVITIVKNGLEGRVAVSGQTYSGIMPHWKGLLSDEQIAAVVTYIRTAWKNRGSPVSISDVRSVQ